MLYLSKNMRVLAPTVENDWKHREELLNFDPSESLYDSTYAGEKLEAASLWFPKIQNNYWENDPTKDCIYETPKDPTKNEWQISRYIDKGEIRITFLKHYNSGYAFQGIFKLDREETRRLNKCVWKKISDKCETELEALKEHINEITKNK